MTPPYLWMIILAAIWCAGHVLLLGIMFRLGHSPYRLCASYPRLEWLLESLVSPLSFWVKRAEWRVILKPLASLEEDVPASDVDRAVHDTCSLIQRHGWDFRSDQHYKHERARDALDELLGKLSGICSRGLSVCRTQAVENVSDTMRRLLEGPTSARVVEYYAGGDYAGEHSVSFNVTIAAEMERLAQSELAVRREQARRRGFVEWQGEYGSVYWGTPDEVDAQNALRRAIKRQKTLAHRLEALHALWTIAPVIAVVIYAVLWA